MAANLTVDGAGLTALRDRPPPEKEGRPRSGGRRSAERNLQTHVTPRKRSAQALRRGLVPIGALLAADPLVREALRRRRLSDMKAAA